MTVTRDFKLSYTGWQSEESPIASARLRVYEMVAGGINQLQSDQEKLLLEEFYLYYEVRSFVWADIIMLRT